MGTVLPHDLADSRDVAIGAELAVQAQRVL
jgi:hypothetical protein